MKEEDAQHLVDTLTEHYKITTDWAGTTYCGLNLHWNYSTIKEERFVQISMDGYVEKALQRFNVATTPTKPQHAPSKWTRPQYGAKVQMTQEPDTSERLQKDGTKRLQEIIGTLLYYARAVDSTMLVALGTLAAAQSKGNGSPETAE